MAEGKKPASEKKPATKKGEKKESIPELEDPDALMTTTLRVMEWTNKHRKQIAYGLALAVAAAGAVFAVSYYRAHREEQASALVAKGVTADMAPLITGAEDPEIMKRLRFYATEAEKQNDALAAYKEAQQKFGDTGPGILARLGEAGVHLDRKSWDDAITAYNDVKNTSLYAADPQIKLRVLEGLGYAKEGKGLLDDARAAFSELANLDVKGAKPLGLYHQARIDVQKNDKQAAIDKLKAADDALKLPGNLSTHYLKDQVEKLLGALDPSLAPKTPAMPGGQIPGMPPGTGPGGKMTKEQIEAFLKSMQGGPGGAPPMPPMPNAPTPPPQPAPAGSK